MASKCYKALVSVVRLKCARKQTLVAADEKAEGEGQRGGEIHRSGAVGVGEDGGR